MPSTSCLYKTKDLTLPKGFTYTGHITQGHLIYHQHYARAFGIALTRTGTCFTFRLLLKECSCARPSALGMQQILYSGVKVNGPQRFTTELRHYGESLLPYAKTLKSNWVHCESLKCYRQLL